MSANIKAVIFDLDGVIIDSNPVIVAFWNECAAKYGFTLTDEMTRQWVYGRTCEDTIAGLFSHIPDMAKEEIITGGKLLGINMPSIPVTGVVSFIQALTVLSIPVGIVTSSDEDRMLKMISQLGILHYFTHFVTKQDITNGKPHPEPYLKMGEKMAVEPNCCLVFEDAISGVQSAKSAGMFVIGVGDALNEEGLLQAGASAVIPHYNQLPFSERQISAGSFSVRLDG